jgi:hypothetical protein
MDVPTSEVGYTSATTGRGVHEVYKGHVVAKLIKKTFQGILLIHEYITNLILEGSPT